MQAIAALLAQLLAIASQLSPYPAPAALPPVELVPSSRLRAHGCVGQCSPNGIFAPAVGILIDERLDLAKDVRARAVLVHEIVHYLQHLNHAHGELSPCDRYLLREREAYAAENRYLARHGLPPSFGYAFMLQTMDLRGCSPG
jgi:hypothetical protein